MRVRAGKQYAEERQGSLQCHALSDRGQEEWHALPKWLLGRARAGDGSRERGGGRPDIRRRADCACKLAEEEVDLIGPPLPGLGQGAAPVGAQGARVLVRADGAAGALAVSLLCWW